VKGDPRRPQPTAEDAVSAAPTEATDDMDWSAMSDRDPLSYDDVPDVAGAPVIDAEFTVVQQGNLPQLGAPAE
jgi:hypothetical protein